MVILLAVKRKLYSNIVIAKALATVLASNGNTISSSRTLYRKSESISNSISK